MKRLFRKGAAILLTATMAMGLAACGGKDAEQSNANSALSKQFVYRCEELSIEDIEGDMSILATSQNDNKIKMLAAIYNYDNYVENDFRLISMNTDGSEVAQVKLEVPSQTDGNSEVISTDVAIEARTEAPTMNLVEGEETATEEVIGTTDLDATDDVVIDDGMIDDGFYPGEESYSYTYYNNFAFGSDGCIYGKKSTEGQDYSVLDEYGNPTYTQTESIVKWNDAGEYVEEYPMESLSTDEKYYYVTKIIPNTDGGLLLLIAGDSFGTIEMNSEGEFTEFKEISELSNYMQSYADMICYEDGRMLITYYDDTWTHMYGVEYNPQTKTVGEEKEIPTFISRNNNGLIASNKYDFMYCNSNGLYGFNFGDTEENQIMNFVNSDLMTYSLNSVLEIDDEHFLAGYYDEENKSQFGLFTKVNPEDIPDKQTILLAGEYVDNEVKKAVVDFNKANEKYRITIKTYYEYNTDEDYTAGSTKLNNDIISGNMPDILLVSTTMPFSSYISKGLIADVGSMIEEDEELSKVSYLQNVFDAFKVNGKLYSIVPTFGVRTMLAKASNVENITEWNMESFQNLLASFPEGTEGIGDVTRENFMYMLMMYNGSNYVDASTGKCNFDSKDFVDALKYAATLPEQFGDDYYTEDYWREYDSRFQNNKTLLMDTYVYSIQDMTNYINGTFLGDAKFVGFPSDFEKKSVIMSNNQYAIAAKSSVKEGAWEFLRTYLTPEYQSNVEWGLPVEENAFMEKAKMAGEKPFYIDENGEKVEYDYTYWMYDESITIDPLSQEQIDEVVNMIKSVDRVYFYNESIINIVNEECGSFFAGQKTAEEVAAIIQNRVQIYVDENN